MKIKKIIITGKVQGVFFRRSAKEQADIMGILGSAENMPDGSVLIYAVGDEVPLQRFIDWCKRGPAGAKVENVTITDVPETREYRWFEILG
ncbi:acylphosphatase [Niabella ginsenosidivorans]|uniref:acylphosphatase n=1 Tax=Niabella ginsenosidivorans TaxID=1176587 RepID=A0A1A9HZ84_9BACT|nr:acylphosphatase [Niabella ginsenosidivorans]ANH80717.1 acylphosphatase [Niabella ginsenosidivorans]